MKNIPLFELRNNNLLPFKFKKLSSGKYFLSNDYGEWVILSENDFRNLIENKLDDENIKNILVQKNMILSEWVDFSKVVNLLAGKWLLRHHYLLHWPSLHIVVVTLWCNQSCRYCHASAPWKDKKYNMSKQMAKKVVDVIFQTTSWEITIEFQWWEPLYNWDVVKYIIEYAEKKNEKYKLKLTFALVSNLTLMDDEKMDYLLKHKVRISTSLDGPKEVHDWNRPRTKWSSFEKVVYWIKKINKEYKKRNIRARVWAIATATRKILDKYKEIVDLYINLWLHSIFIRPLNPYWFAAKTWDIVWYSMEEYEEFYKNMINYIRKVRKEKLKKWSNKISMFKDAYAEWIIGYNLNSCQRLNFMEERTPCGAVLWQIAYNYDGKIYTCDEWRMLAEAWDYSFKVWEISLEKSAKQIRKELITNVLTRYMVSSSIIDTIPWYDTNPVSNYCGVCPIYSYIKSWNLVSKYRKEWRMRLQEFVIENLLSNIDLWEKEA